MAVRKFKWSAGMIALISALALVIIIALWFVGTYNSLVTLQNNIEGQWSQIEVQYQRRADLLPNLVNTIKGFTDQEQTIILGATELRTQWQSAQTREEKIAAAQNIDKQLDSSNPTSLLGRINVVVESYPQLKSDQNFLALQVELSNTENKIAQERRLYNMAVQTYNRKIRVVPSNIIAGMFGFTQQTYFESAIGTEQAPVITF